MWKQLVAAARHLLVLGSRVDMNDEQVRALQEELKAMRFELAVVRRALASVAHAT